jgi:hypothetical protein
MYLLISRSLPSTVSTIIIISSSGSSHSLREKQVLEDKYTFFLSWDFFKIKIDHDFYVLWCDTMLGICLVCVVPYIFATLFGVIPSRPLYVPSSDNSVKPSVTWTSIMKLICLLVLKANALACLWESSTYKTRMTYLVASNSNPLPSDWLLGGTWQCSWLRYCTKSRNSRLRFQVM